MTFQVETTDSGRAQFRFTNVGAVAGGEAFLIRTGRANFLYDSGFAFGGRVLADNLRAALGGERLDYILLTHSHYDHAGGGVYVQEAYPEAKIVAGDYAAAIFAKPTARARMRQLDDAEAALKGYAPCDDRLDGLHADIAVRDGEVLTLGGHRVRVVGLPGHTKCSVGFYFEDEKVLLGSETLGVFVKDDLIMPAILVGYGMAMESLQKVQQMEVREMLVPHRGMLYGADCAAFCRRSAEWVQDARGRILEGARQGLDEEQLAEEFILPFRCEELAAIYPEKACRLNNGITVRLVLKEYGGQTPDLTSLHDGTDGFVKSGKGD